MANTKTLEDIENEILRLKEHYAEERTKELPLHSSEYSFDSPANLKNKAKFEVMQTLDTVKHEIHHGMQAVLDYLEQYQPVKYEEFTSWFEQNASMILENLQSKVSIESTSDSNSMVVPSTLTETISEVADLLIENAQLDEAAEAMLICVSLEPQSLAYWIKYSSILQLKGDDIAALYALQVALALDDSNPYVYAHIARSWLVLNLPQDAIENLDKAIYLCEIRNGLEELVSYCKTLKMHCETLDKEARK